MAIRKYRQLGKKHLKIFKFWKTKAHNYRLSIPLRDLRGNKSFEALPVYCILDELDILKEQLHNTDTTEDFNSISHTIDYLSYMLDKYKFVDK